MDIERLAGTRLGNYEIERLLGRGGMGVVYKACQINLDRAVALTILPAIPEFRFLIQRNQESTTNRPGSSLTAQVERPTPDTFAACEFYLACFFRF